MARAFAFMPMHWRDGRWAISPRHAAATSPGRAASTPVPLRIASWNAWLSDYRSPTRFRALLAELRQRHVDVIALQEVTQELLDLILSAPWIRSSYQVSEPEVIGYDVIILSRLPIRRMATVPLPGTMGRRLIVAELACGLEVATVHLESTPPATAVRLQQLAIVFEYLGSRGDAVLVGDMNFDPTASLETGAIDPRFVGGHRRATGNHPLSVARRRRQ